MKEKKIAGLITAGGSSSRMKDGINKLFIPINGIPILIYSVIAFSKSEKIDSIFISVKENLIPLVKSLCISYKINKKIVVVKGGETRQESVKNLLLSVPNEIDIVCVHDGARPMITSKSIDFLLTNFTEDIDGILPCTSITDTVKKIDKNNIIISTEPRDELVRVQTPQIFKKDILTEAYKKAEEDKFTGTDEASLVERLSKKIKVIKLQGKNLKITYKEDIETFKKFLFPKDIIKYANG